MAIVVENGTGLPNAQSYAAVASADTYFTAHLHPGDWLTLEPTRKEAALIMATQRLDATVTWKGTRLKGDQALGWPREGVTLADGTPVLSSVVPARVAYATFELAKWLVGGDRDAATTTAAVKREKVDVLEVEYFEAARAPIVPEVALRMIAELIASEAEQNAGGNPNVGTAQSFTRRRA